MYVVLECFEDYNFGIYDGILNKNEKICEFCLVYIFHRSIFVWI